MIDGLAEKGGERAHYLRCVTSPPLASALKAYAADLKPDISKSSYGGAVTWLHWYLLIQE